MKCHLMILRLPILLSDTLKSCSRDIQFTCTSGECIPTSWKCDGNFDCEDRSDEATALCSSNTTGVPCEAERGFFLCEDGLLCLNSTQACYCSRYPIIRFSHHSECNISILLIPYRETQVCDSTTQCQDQSDEGSFCLTPGCDTLECDQVM